MHVCIHVRVYMYVRMYVRMYVLVRIFVWMALSERLLTGYLSLRE